MARAASIVWLRRDLRTDDHPALVAAASRGSAVVPVVFIDRSRLGCASAWWLRHSLAALDTELQVLGSRLLVRQGPAVAGLLALADELGADHIDYNAHLALAERDDEAELARQAPPALGVHAHAAESLYAPGSILTRGGSPYLIYSPFARACLDQGHCARPLRPPLALAAPDVWPPGADLDDLDLRPVGGSCSGLEHQWEPGSRGGARRIEWLVQRRLRNYHRDRNRPGLHATSGLSPHLTWGEVSLRRLWQTVLHSRGDRPYADLPDGYRAFLDELLWREFAQHLLWHRPEMAETPLRPRFADFPWRDDPAQLAAWQQGQTGFPLVDAGMRQLLRLGWMHNRLRMVVASFLVKDLLLPWQTGAAWFAQRLVDYDPASNSLNWQWCAGTGIDSAAFTRVFNPVSQGRACDADGRFVRRWVPELAALPDRWLHEPWAAPPAVLEAARVRLGQTYPLPLVEHSVARDRALAAYAQPSS